MFFQTSNIFRLGDQLYLEWNSQEEDIFFQIQVDDGAWSANLNINSYSIPMQPLGDHIIRIKACNVEVCSETTDVTFRIVPRSIPKKPEGILIYPGN